MHKQVIFFALLLFANLFALTGTIQDERGNPLEGVSVWLLGLDTSVTTDASGNFVFDIITPVVASTNQASSQILTYSQNKLTFQSPGNTPIEVIITNPLGKVVFKERFISLKGLNAISLPYLSSGIYLMKMSLGDEYIVQKFIPNQRFSVNIKKSIITTRQSRANTAVDRIFLEVPSYTDTLVQVYDYNESLGIITLKPQTVLTPGEADGTWLLVYEKQKVGGLERSFTYDIDSACELIKINGDTVITYTFNWSGSLDTTDTIVYQQGDLLDDEYIDVTISGDTLKLYEGCQFGEAVHNYVRYSGDLGALTWEGYKPLEIDSQMLGTWYASAEIRGGQYSDTHDTVAIVEDTLESASSETTASWTVEITADSLFFNEGGQSVYRTSWIDDYESYKNLMMYKGALVTIYELEFRFWGNGIKGEYWYYAHTRY